MLRLIILIVLASDVPIPKNLPFAPLTIFRQECIALEIMDPREGWLFGSNCFFSNNVKVMRERYKDLQNAPPLADSEMFPCEEVLQNLLNFNHECRQRLDSRLYVPWEKDMVRVYSDDLMVRYQVYDAIMNVKRTAYDVAYRRQALKRLRDEVLGPEQYYYGKLPRIVPIGYFKRID